MILRIDYASSDEYECERQAEVDYAGPNDWAVRFFRRGGSPHVKRYRSLTSAQGAARGWVQKKRAATKRRKR